MNSRTTLLDRLTGIFEFGGTLSDRRDLPMEGVRGLAVILVFFVHYNSHFGSWISENSISFTISRFLWSIGHSGVDLFFVLSGYLIYGSIIKKSRPYISFIKRRIERIYPTFLFVFAIYLILSIFFPAKNKIPADLSAAIVYVLENLLLLPGLFNIEPLITVAWSLSYEFFYYLFIPVVVGVFGLRRWSSSARIVFFFILAAAIIAGPQIGVPLPFRMIMFISGVLLYETMHVGCVRIEREPRSDRWVIIFVLITFPLIYALSDGEAFLPFGLEDNLAQHLRIVVLSVGFFFLSLACFSYKSTLSRVFAWTPLRWLGNISYSYYLIHGLTIQSLSMIVVNAINGRTFAPIMFWLVLPVVFGITLTTSALLFILVEKRFSLTERPALPASANLPTAHQINLSPKLSEAEHV
ncbi:MAG: acyltransferase [Pyrinomonadaceae bacterium]